MLVSAAVIPHGDFAVDPTLLPTGSKSRVKAEALNTASMDTASTLLTLVDKIVLITPHGLAADEDLAIYLGVRGSGYAPIGRDAGNDGHGKCWNLPLHGVVMDDARAKCLRDFLRASDTSGNKVSGLTSYGGYADTPLRYGEVIPLSFFLGRTESEDHDWVMVNTKEEEGEGYDLTRGKSNPPCIILSLPNRRYTEGPNMVDEMLRIGADLAKYLDSIPDRFALVVSADLAHTHESSGPYGYSPAAQPFDDACAAWARDLDGPPLLETARELLSDAKSCGYLGLVILHGALNELASKGNDANLGNSWQCKLHTISHPTYYGMMVSSYIRQRFPSFSTKQK